ncbi:MAG: hypothetical protein IJN38_03355 [Clostridia bacterium]|nr:hypothetical protein [Clostridia bacterium]
MKKVLSFVFALTLVLSMFCINASAVVNDSNIFYFEDGSFVTISEVEDTTISRASNTKNAQRTATHTDSNGNVLWKATLKATFTYTGSSATCTNSNITYTISDSSWKITEATATKSGNKATGNVTAKKYVLGIPFKTVEETITITCSANGTLS